VVCDDLWTLVELAMKADAIILTPDFA